jgi:methionine biosynthesis protein MetW
MAQLELAPPAAAPLDLVLRADHEAIALMVHEGARVLDIGCGDGTLISLLADERGAVARGIEIDQSKVHGCVRRGLPVVQADGERDLEDFPSGSYDVVVFSRTLQHLRRPQAALRQAARIGERVIVSIANAAHWRRRLRLLGQGRFARAEDQDIAHAYSVRDFAEQARAMRLTVERAIPLSRGHAGAPFAKNLWRANWLAEEAVFLLAG